MEMYTGIRFKGVVKEEFRDKFEDIALDGEWSESDVPEFKEFSDDAGIRSSFIPCGVLSYMPKEWEEEPFDRFGNGIPTDGFERTWDRNTGRWTFQCSLKNYGYEIETFFELIPFFVESIEHLEYFYEEWGWSSRYDLVNGKVVLVNDKFIKY